jgi:phospholipid transport system transporter-binding protein
MSATSLTMVVGDDGTIYLQGELLLTTIDEALALSRPLFMLHCGDLTIDLAGVSRGDSAAIALLIHWVREFRSHGRYLSFSHTPPHLLRLAEASELLQILPFATR